MRFFNPDGKHGGQATDAVEGSALSLSGFLLCCALLPGCGAIVVLLDSGDTGEGARHGLVYCGVCFDCRQLGHRGGMFFFPDIPFSLVADTLIFPYTFTYQCIEFFRTDERLHGTWRSDEDLVVAERQWFLYHDQIKRHEYDWDYKNRTVQPNCRPVITFSEHHVTISLEGMVRAFRYRVVRQYEDSVVMGGIPESSELQTVEFLPDGILLEAFWAQPRHYSKTDPGQ
jgi:uncharacterized protein YceK